MNKKKKVRRSAACRLVTVAASLVLSSLLLLSPLFAQPQNADPQADLPRIDDDANNYVKGLDDLMYARLEKEKAKYRGQKILPEMLRVESNYIRTDAPTGEVVLYETSFHLEPRYIAFYPEGLESVDRRTQTAQSAMYFVGAARTPLALPLVSTLSKVLSGDEASYTVYLGILPLPRPENAMRDSLHFYCVIERAIQSNRSESEVKLDRYAKEFSFKIGEPIQLRVDNTPPDRPALIVKIEDNTEPLNFYEDFARHFNEHIILNSGRLKFDLGKASLSHISPSVSIPYTVGKPSHIKLEMLSVIDEAHPVVLMDSLMKPADYLVQHDIKDLINGTYRYRMTAKEPSTGDVIFTDTKTFEKKQPVMVGRGIDLANADTLEVGGKKFSAQERLRELNMALQVEKVRSERLEADKSALQGQYADIKEKFEATQGDVISGITVRGGLGFGKTTGVNLFVGAESQYPSLTLDASIGLLYSSSVPFLSYEEPQNFSQIFNSPKSIGLQIGYSPFSFLDGILKPVVRLGYYGIFSAETPATAGGRHSATLIEPCIGIMTTPGGTGTNFGFDFTIGPAFGLGVNAPAEFDVQAKFYLRF